MADCCGSDRIRRDVSRHYAQVALQAEGGCCSSTSGCGASCCGGASLDVTEMGQQMGYSAEELACAPAEANLGLGCGNPGAIAALRPGEVVLDLGSGGGLDCFLASRQVGETGRVIGVDMTPDMVSRARENAARGGYTNVEFRLGEIEHLPVADSVVDVILSNCVINLSPDKRAVFADAFRVLRPGGRLAISDMVAIAPLPEEALGDMALWSACVSGAPSVDELRATLREVGFEQICIQVKDESRALVREWVPGSSIDEYVLSATIEAVKPAS